MSKNEIQQRVPMIKIIMEDGDVHYLPKDQEDRFLEDCNRPKLIRINGLTFRTRDIKKILPHTATGAEDLPKVQRERIEARIEGYRKTFAEYPSPKQIQHWIRTELI